ncbi:MAG: DUF2530 domain-containing protein [Micropruina sp.]
MTNDREPHLPTLQAPVKALDPHGVQIVGLGTALFIVGTLICWWQLPVLAASGRGWWLWSAIVGSSIGVLALVVLLILRRIRLR